MRALASFSLGMASRKLIKVAAIVAFLYCTLLVYQGGVNYQPRVQVQELTVDSVTKSSVNNSDPINKITLDDLFISVKTTKYYENTRLPIILKTWFQLAKNQTWFFTDRDYQFHQIQTNGHMVNTKCSPTHSRNALCCKMAVEYDRYLESKKKWFCHFDDDNYVNVPRLVEVLQRYDYKKEWYLGRTSVYRPVLIYHKSKRSKKTKVEYSKLKYSFWFGTGGAGVCLSRSLALKMLPFASGGRFISFCDNVRFPDDVSLGYLIENIMKINLTVVPEFHSHLEQMKLLDTDKLKDQVSFGYSLVKDEWNVVNVPGFDTRYDPTRFLSLHCFLFPHFKFCPR
ncbi:fringe glycosyltransferase isoform X1 [Cydia fagiglandana]|uniref:fringe glycosyltransferase isoform X1 n=1 Tax=Cydia fagiglandana TaxID=1458189 RepID=UPI002FEE0384